MNFSEKKIISFVLLVFVLLLIFPKPVHSATWLFLKNISGVGLFLENRTIHKEAKKLNIESIYESSSDRLKNAKIKVYRDSQWKNNWGGAFIKVKIISSKFTEHENFAVYIDTSVYRPVVILGATINKNEGVNASSWSTGKLFSCNQKNFQTCVQTGINELLDLFINDYISVNGIK